MATKCIPSVAHRARKLTEKRDRVNLSIERTHSEGQQKVAKDKTMWLRKEAQSKIRSAKERVSFTSLQETVSVYLATS